MRWIKDARRVVVAATIGVALQLPSGAAAAPALKEYLIVSNREGHVERYDLQTGKFAGTVAKRGENGLNVPYGMTLGPDGVLYVASVETETHRYPPGTTGAILKYDPADGRYLGVFASLPSRGWSYWDITFGRDGHLYTVAQDWTGKTPTALQRYDGKSGALLATLDTMSGTAGMALGGQSVGPYGNLYVGYHGWGPDGVRVFDGSSGALLGDVKLPHTGFTLFNAFDRDGRFYVSDYFDGNIDVYDFRPGASGSFVRTIPGISGAQGLALDVDGTLYAAAYYGNAIAEIRLGSDRATLHQLQGLRGPVDVVIATAPVPEPATWASMLAGLLALAVVARRRLGR